MAHKSKLVEIKRQQNTEALFRFINKNNRLLFDNEKIILRNSRTIEVVGVKNNICYSNVFKMDSYGDWRFAYYIEY